MGLASPLVWSPLEFLGSSIVKNTPSFSCGVQEFEIYSRFTNFTCKNQTAFQPEKANTYFQCIASLLVMNILDFGSVTSSNCSNVDFNSAGEMFADCEWCTEDYGCFQIGGPWISPCHQVSLPPQPLPCLDLKLQLYTRLNPTSPQLLNTNLSNINETNFKANLKTMFLIGGWQEGDFKPYDSMTVKAALNVGEMNVIVFNWNEGSGTLYGQAAANTRILGRMLAYILRDLQTNLSYPLANVYLVGHSLGAQLAGFAGKELRTLGNYTVGRITGLDPAGPYFNCQDGRVRLTATDATFVDVIHSNAGGLGDLVTNGDIDFWPNGGTFQPGCDPISRIFKDDVKDKIFCEHTMSIYFFAYSMFSDSQAGNCSFNADMCSSYINFKAGNCQNCGVNSPQCAEMGYYASKYFDAGYQIPANQSFYLDTLSGPPYCENLAK